MTTHEIASEVNSAAGGSAPSGMETVKVARNCAMSSQRESSAMSFPGHILLTQTGNDEHHAYTAEAHMP